MDSLIKLLLNYTKEMKKSSNTTKIKKSLRNKKSMTSKKLNKYILDRIRVQNKEHSNPILHPETSIIRSQRRDRLRRVFITQLG